MHYCFLSYLLENPFVFEFSDDNQLNSFLIGKFTLTLLSSLLSVHCIIMLEFILVYPIADALRCKECPVFFVPHPEEQRNEIR